ncbi:MAG TPA: metal ABC transporter substrate-binding protein [Methanoregula sp.]|nr:metal ABC transporter substrate-binding protein [Methanoregula sp.]
MVRLEYVPVLQAAVLVITIALSAASGCTAGPGGSDQAGPAPGTGYEGGIPVITSFRPLTLLVAPVGGDHITLTQILPPGADPHDYEPTPADALALRNGRIFFYDGPFLEPWAAALAGSANPDLKLVSFPDTIPGPVYEEMKSRYPGFPNLTEDPHLWLSPQLAEYYVAGVARQLSETDPANATYYQNNAAAFEGRLAQLDSDYKAGLSDCSTRTLLSSHAFLDYTAAAYNLTPISISGMNPDAEPSLRQMAAIIQEAKTSGARGILAEPDEAEDLSKSVASELNVPVYPFTTMEILPPGQGTPEDSDYVSIMENNLKEMKRAMACP